MSELGDIIKELAVNAVEAEKPVEAVIGIVVRKEPLRIQLEQRLVIDRKFIDICSGAVYENDSKVALLRYKGGQKYLLLDSVV